MLIALGLAATLMASDPDGVVATAPVGAGAVPLGAVAPTADASPQATAITPHNLTTQQQIDRWLAARAPESDPFSDDRAPVDDRRMHGFVSGAIGTGDYSAVEVGISVPVGETGRLDLIYSQSRNGYGLHGPGYGYGYGYDYGSHGQPFGLRGDGWGPDGPVFVSGLASPGRPFAQDDRRRGFGLSYRSRQEDKDDDVGPR